MSNFLLGARRTDDIPSELTVGNKDVVVSTKDKDKPSPPLLDAAGQQKSLTDALNDIIPDVFENLDIQPLIDHDLIHSDLFRTAESLISSTIFSMCIHNFAMDINRWGNICLY